MEKFGAAVCLGSLVLIVSAFGACSSPAPSAGFQKSDSDAAVQVTTLDAGDDSATPAPSSDDGGLGGWHPGTGADAADAATGDGGVETTTSTTITTSVGPIPVMSNEETTVCITLRLPNTDSVYIPRITVDLAPGSHHLVVYRSMATEENLTPAPCTAFQGILMGQAVPLMISEKLADDLTFPQGVALKIEPHQMIELEAHYINTGATTLQGTGNVHFETVPVTTANVIESDLGFFGTLGIVIPPGVQSNGPMFVKGLAGTHGFALTTHEHRLGTDFKIWAATSATDVNHTPVADTTDWSNPPLYRLSPELDFDGNNGLAYQCTWNNTTGQVVTFGESALQEMCFLWMYYYPSQGFDMRFQ
jgi:Copper type II ascorbate-dependent monooxygenase, C-terminal domain